MVSDERDALVPEIGPGQSHALGDVDPEAVKQAGDGGQGEERVEAEEVR